MSPDRPGKFDWTGLGKTLYRTGTSNTSPIPMDLPSDVFQAAHSHQSASPLFTELDFGHAAWQQKAQM